jgi:hypothetical protein
MQTYHVGRIRTSTASLREKKGKKGKKKGGWLLQLRRNNHPPNRKQPDIGY